MEEKEKEQKYSQQNNQNPISIDAWIGREFTSD